MTTAAIKLLSAQNSPRIFPSLFVPWEQKTMKLRFKPFLTAALFALGVISTPALSQDAGWFAGLGGGLSKFDDGCPGGAVPGFTCDDRGASWRIFGGYQFNANFGYELGYANLGETTQSTAGVGSDTFEAKAFEMTLVVTIPFNQWYSLYGKWGIFRWDLDRTTVGAGAGTTSTSGKDKTFGLGVKYNFAKNIALQMEWQRYLDVGDPGTTGRSNVDDYGVSVVFKF